MTLDGLERFNIRRASLHLLLLVESPPLKDCSEVFHAGFQQAGRYELDPTGNRLENQTTQLYCEDSWTWVLERNELEESPVILAKRKEKL